MNTEEKLTLFMQESLVNRTAMQDYEKESRMNVINGMNCIDFYMRFNRHGFVLKTFTDYLVNQAEWYSRGFVLTWKVRGTKYNRLLFRLVPSVRHTVGTECGYLLKTPTTAQCEGRRPGTDGKSTGTLAQQFQFGLLITPTSSEHIGGVMELRHGANARYKLRDQIANLPTPTVHGNNNKKGSSKKAGDGLTTVLRQTLPTPQATDGTKNGSVSQNQESIMGFGRNIGLRLQPEFVEWMMGFPEGFTNVLHNNKRIARAKRLEMLGNAVVPQIVLQIFKAIEHTENTLKQERK